ncbi:LrgB family protein [gut metagenome]|uniref:LrgB family protein n=1 Tax=gut metagenome TaxID=749906 RepID=J9FQ67_9ZZZZ
MEFLENKFFLLALTFGVFFVSRLVQRRTGWVVLNPILLTIAVLITFLKCMDIPYETYNEGGSLIEFWLRPAVVALGVPLYLQLEMIKKQWLPILISQLAGCVVGLVAVVVIAKWLGASPEIICSLAPKSVTTPIAMEVSKATGGIPSLTAAVVVVVGLFGAVFGFKVLRVGRVGSPIAQGLSMGTATHAVGTSAAMEVSGKYGAYASLGLTLNGIMTALLTPTVLHLLGVI